MANGYEYDDAIGEGSGFFLAPSDPLTAPQEEDLRERGEQLALGTQPTQTAQIDAALRHLRALAGGSQATALQDFGSQFDQLRQAYAQATRNLGRSLSQGRSSQNIGGQINRARQQLLGNFGSRAATLFGNAVNTGTSGLLNFFGAQGLPGYPTAPPQTTYSPFDPGILGSSLFNIASYGQNLFGSAPAPAPSAALPPVIPDAFTRPPSYGK